MHQTISMASQQQLSCISIALSRTVVFTVLCAAYIVQNTKLLNEFAILNLFSSIIHHSPVVNARIEMLFSRPVITPYRSRHTTNSQILQSFRVTRVVSPVLGIMEGPWMVYWGSRYGARFPRIGCL